MLLLPQAPLLSVRLQAEAQEFISSCDCPTYLAHAERRLGEEAERVQNYLDACSEPRVIQVGGLVVVRPYILYMRESGWAGDGVAVEGVGGWPGGRNAWRAVGQLAGTEGFGGMLVYWVMQQPWGE